MMVGIHQSVTLAQLDEFVYLAGVYQAVSSNDEFIGRNGGDNLLVETYDFNEATSAHIVQLSFLYGLPYMLRTCGHKHFQRVFAR